MAGLLRAHRRANHLEQFLLQFAIACAGIWSGVAVAVGHRLSAVVFPQKIAQADFLVAEQTHLEIAVGGDAEAGTGGAEMLRHASDEAEGADEAGDVISFAGVVVVVGVVVVIAVVLVIFTVPETMILLRDLVVLERGICGFDGSEHFAKGYQLRRGPFIAVKGHVFNEPDLEGLVPGQLDKGEEFPVIDPPHDDAIEFQSDVGA